MATIWSVIFQVLHFLSAQKCRTRKMPIPKNDGPNWKCMIWNCYFWFLHKIEKLVRHFLVLHFPGCNFVICHFWIYTYEEYGDYESGWQYSQDDNLKMHSFFSVCSYHMITQMCLKLTLCALMLLDTMGCTAAILKGGPRVVCVNSTKK